MIATWLTLAALSGRWQICPFTSAYRGRATCMTWAPATEFKLEGSRLTLLSVRHFDRGPRYCHFSSSYAITEAGPRGSRFRVVFEPVEDVVLETGAKFESCSVAHGSERVGRNEWVFETYGELVLVKMPDGLKPHLLRRF